jgi:methylmalonyl-CoA/ethylmalonyl-CoA epimerase
MGIQAKNPNEDDEGNGLGVGGEPIDEAFDGGQGAPLLTSHGHRPRGGGGGGWWSGCTAVHRRRPCGWAKPSPSTASDFGVLVVHREELHDEDAEVAFLEVGGSSIALIAPTSADSPYREFLDEGGPGLHHVAYRVDDCAQVLADLADAGHELLDEEPRPGPQGSKVAFVHPDAAFGVLVQLVER